MESKSKLSQNIGRMGKNNKSIISQFSIVAEAKPLEASVDVNDSKFSLARKSINKRISFEESFNNTFNVQFLPLTALLKLKSQKFIEIY